MKHVSLARKTLEQIRSETIVPLAIHLDAFWMLEGHDFGRDAYIQACMFSWGNSDYHCVNEYGELF